MAITHQQQHYRTGKCRREDEAAASKAAPWIESYQGTRIVISHSLTEVVDGKQGISLINIFNPSRWLVWDAAVITNEPAKQYMQPMQSFIA
ncbi:hypothetical protein ACX80E_17140 [Arthrobacter sp. TMN-49]